MAESYNKPEKMCILKNIINFKIICYKVVTFDMIMLSNQKRCEYVY